MVNWKIIGIGVACFGAGGLTGYLITKSVLDKKYKESCAKIRKEYEQYKKPIVQGFVAPTEEQLTLAEEQALAEAIIENCGYAHVADFQVYDFVENPGLNAVELYKDDVKDIPDDIVISFIEEEEFGEIESYETVYLQLFSDGVLANEYGKAMNHDEELAMFGSQFTIDAMKANVRRDEVCWWSNPAKEYYGEISYFPISYDEYLRTHPHVRFAMNYDETDE